MSTNSSCRKRYCCFFFHFPLIVPIFLLCTAQRTVLKGYQNKNNHPFLDVIGTKAFMEFMFHIVYTGIIGTGPWSGVRLILTFFFIWYDEPSKQSYRKQRHIQYYGIRIWFFGEMYWSWPTKIGQQKVDCCLSISIDCICVFKNNKFNEQSFGFQTFWLKLFAKKKIAHCIWGRKKRYKTKLKMRFNNKLK